MPLGKRRESKIPTIDLVPMLTVMMGVLAFFVVISVSLGSEQLIEVELPPEQTEDVPPDQLPSADEIFIVEMDENQETSLNGQPIDSTQLALEIDNYLQKNPDKTVYLVPDQELPYENVMQFLGDMRAVGGDQVSLALEDAEEEE
ncbi:biopolymer transporter ExbD [Leptolyngbyaceae cyanobacterium CCMR0082]|uniref:Biopolymer transporter ExbD n=1 Tax=Adonisia turfae CCMR0082 TaxID=2304604 RepID=A0A6M0SHW7_9CYAN|nr:biopolymer transporter ExbD [Adonisia turfae]MDV3353169.1 biopolymer transporter ExbD [Leptothoe sp. LEGE 181152]NEZ68160.1 biopolymer transporter ExbD [Adonisia turfae CCMR0082]